MWNVVPFSPGTREQKVFKKTFCSRVPGENGTSEHKLSRRRRTLGELAYANGHEWIFAQQIALMCGSLYLY